MTNEQPASPESAPDSSDVVEGPIGSARLKAPTDPGPTGADLDALPEIDAADTDNKGGGNPA